MATLWSEKISRRHFGALATSSVLAPLLHGNGLDDVSEVPWLGEIQQPPADSVDDGLDLGAGFSPAANLSAWRPRREQLRQWWLSFLGEIKRSAEPPATTVIAEEELGTVVRQRVRYESEPGWPTEAYVLRPVDDARRARPGVVVFHSTVDHSIRQPAGVEGKLEKAFGIELAKRGFVTFCPRNFLWPNNHAIDTDAQMRQFAARHPRSKGMAKMLLDAQVAWTYWHPGRMSMNPASERWVILWALK